MEENQIEGIIEAVSIKKKGYAIKIKENWYSAFEKCSVNKGDKVNLTYAIKGDFKNIKKIEVIEKTEKEFKDTDEFNKKRQKEILKGQCFNKGIDIYLATKPDPIIIQGAILVAKELYKKALEEKYFEW